MKKLQKAFYVMGSLKEWLERWRERQDGDGLAEA
jgi:hypothetical protein